MTGLSAVFDWHESPKSQNHLHNGERGAAKVSGAEAEQEVCGWRGQEWREVHQEPPANKIYILQLCSAEVGHCHLSKSLKNGWPCLVIDVVGGLRIVDDWKKKTKGQWKSEHRKSADLCALVVLTVPWWITCWGLGQVQKQEFFGGKVSTLPQHRS